MTKTYSKEGFKYYINVYGNENKEKVYENNELSLLNWCLLNKEIGGKILCTWDVFKNACNGLYISDIGIHNNVDIWIKESFIAESRKVKLYNLLDGSALK